jgi:hypothetical protein
MYCMAAPTTLRELEQTPAPAADPAPVWLQRTSLVVFVLFCFYIGGLLAVLPWTSNYWEVMQQGWARGVISGLGLIDLWIAVTELLHYRDYRAAPPQA